MTIKELREKTNLSQRGFAERFDIPVRTVQQWEQGKCSPPAYLIKLIEHEVNSCKITHNNDYISQYKLKSEPAWQVCIPQTFMNCIKIHPLQQSKVKQLLDDISCNKNICKIIIFGSSVTNQCHIGSDVDIFVQSKEDINPLNAVYPFKVDFWNNFRVDKHLMNEIEKTGVVVYEQ